VAKWKLDLKILRKIRSRKWNVIYTGLKNKREKEKKYFSRIPESDNLCYLKNENREETEKQRCKC
jgi:hypothetical protein